MNNHTVDENTRRAMSPIVWLLGVILCAVLSVIAAAPHWLAWLGWLEQVNR